MEQTVDRSSWAKSTLLTFILFILAALLLWSRCPARLTHPNLWAEDGVVWLAASYDNGPAVLGVPLAGYLQTLSRLTGVLAVQGKLTYVPLIFSMTAFAVQLLPVALLLSRRGVALLPSRAARLLLAVYYLLQPNTVEIYVNLTNAMWHLALAAFLIIVFPKPRSFAAYVFDVALLVLSGLSGPLVLFLAPIAWWQCWKERSTLQVRPSFLYAVLLTLCALLQLYFIANGAGGGRQSHLGATVLLFVHILANQVILAAIVGQGWVLSLINLPWWTGAWWAAVPVLLAVAATLWAFCKGSALYRQFLALALLSLLAALKSPMITPVQPQWVPMQYPGIGGRYFFLPQLAWFATLLVLASLKPRWVRWTARLLMLCCIVGLVADWEIVPYPSSPFAAQARLFEKMPVGSSMTFDENPPGWQFSLTKH